MEERELNPKVDEFLAKAKTWKEEYKKLRTIILDCELTEDFKWMHPCYTLNSKNVVLMHGFNDYVALLFHKGALLKDEHGILIQQTENVQSARQIRFTNVQEIVELEPILKAYVKEATEVERAGMKVVKEKKDLVYPEEFKAKLDEVPGLKEAFEALTPGRQRMYVIHFSSPKQSKTRTSRVEKCMPKIFEGKGINDR
ncbi:YdeI/OmpD-associated family protein [Aureibacillus halotolerans]|uniref:Uncharacterized protein YdeI (YjbR/CyaY-like superfamily) n=1 Tax=Aureibacillus halotolerans TaxID=1508390 RepID=A0A4R6TSG0_9BACI|nr:YdeI family protein [Aureibacillus halotolerans]TDQ35437.1 uncharacterized protein YdeI (YjbR/CyaY-like superfamily) [Aureibacillus halotolerans]